MAFQAKQKASADKTYKLKSKAAPLSFILPSRNTQSFPLFYFDEPKNSNRELRYCPNQKSPFVDEQVGVFNLAPIVFERGFLTVPRNNPALQEFLHYHPLNGVSFEVVDIEKDASVEVDKLTAEVDALVAARGLSVEQMENITRVLFGRDPSSLKTAVMQRDILIYARQHPKEFLNQLDDPQMALQANTRAFFDRGLLVLRNQNRDVYFNLTANKRKMLAVPFGEDPYQATASYLQTDEGIDILKMLENEMQNT